MRVIENDKDCIERQAVAYFAGDLKGGGVRVECQKCFKETELPFSRSHIEHSEYCSHCKRELMYPSKASW
jgi:ribosomal protein S27E